MSAVSTSDVQADCPLFVREELCDLGPWVLPRAREVTRDAVVDALDRRVLAPKTRNTTYAMPNITVPCLAPAFTLPSPICPATNPETNPWMIPAWKNSRLYASFVAWVRFCRFPPKPRPVADVVGDTPELANCSLVGMLGMKTVSRDTTMTRNTKKAM